MLALRDGVVSVGWALRVRADVRPYLQPLRMGPGAIVRPGDIRPLGPGWRPDLYGSAILSRMIGGEDLELVRVDGDGVVVEVVP